MKSWVRREKYIPMYIDKILELVKTTFLREIETNKQPKAPQQCAKNVCYVQNQGIGMTGLHQHGDQERPFMHGIEIYENKCLK